MTERRRRRRVPASAFSCSCADLSLNSRTRATPRVRRRGSGVGGGGQEPGGDVQLALTSFRRAGCDEVQVFCGNSGVSAKAPRFALNTVYQTRRTCFGVFSLAQLPIRLTTIDLARYDAYASRLGLDRTGLANLLLRRELACPTLSHADRTPVQRSTGSKPNRDERVTAHLPSECLDRFRSRARELGLTLSAAGALVLLLELDNEWLLQVGSK